MPEDSSPSNESCAPRFNPSQPSLPSESSPKKFGGAGLVVVDLSDENLVAIDRSLAKHPRGADE